MTVKIAVVTFVLVASTAVAQPRVEEFRAYVAVNGGYQAPAGDFQDSIDFTEFVEQGTVDSSYGVAAGPALDIAGGARLWHALGVGVGVTRFSKTTDASVTAQIPHPFLFDRARSVTGAAVDLKRQEVAVHIQAIFFLPLTERMQVAVFGGPSFFSVTQGLVRSIRYTHRYPYDTAEFSAADTEEASASKAGFNVGADVGYFFTRNMGVGGVIRLSRASVDFTSADGDLLAVDVGGFQAGGGFRLRF